MTDTRNFWEIAMQQLSVAPPRIDTQSRYNPRPAGQIVEGSTTDLILKVLKEAPGFMTHAQILWKVERARGAVAWGLQFLQAKGLIRSVPDGCRNPRYRKYIFIRKGPENGS